MTGSEQNVRARGVPFGRYVIKRRLGRGGMGEVFLADQLGPLGPVRPVALKRMLPQFAHDKSVVDLFLREMSTAALLNHPNIATVYDFGEVDGVYFIAMEYVDGLTVNDILAKLGALPVGDAITIARCTLEALAHAHALKRPGKDVTPVVHSDISPHNLIISSEGAVKLLDFGLARAEAAVLGGPVRGKLGYVAPEQAEGQPTDRRFDLYAAGVVLYELLAGARPFQADNVQRMIAMQRAKQFVRIHEKRPDARILSAIIEHAMEPDPARRFEAAPAFLAAMSSLAGSGRAELAALVERAGGARRFEEREEATQTGMVIDRSAPSGEGEATTIRATEQVAVDDSPTLPPGMRIPPSQTELAPTKIAPRRSSGARRRMLKMALAASVMAILGGTVGYVTTRGGGEMATVTVVAKPAAELGGASVGAARATPSPEAPVAVPTPDVPAAVPVADDREPSSPHGDVNTADAKNSREGKEPSLRRRLRALGDAKAGAGTREGAARAGREGREGSSREGSSREGSSREGSSRDAVGRDGVGRDGVGRDGVSRDGVGRDGAGRDSSATGSAERAGGDSSTGDTERRPSEAVPTGLGVLSVRSTPWSRVTLDGKSLGEGIVAGRPVPAGKHTLILTPGNDEYPARTVNIEIKVGVVTKVFVDFPAGTVRIDPS